MISSHAVINLEVFEGATFYREFTWEVGDPSVPVDLDGISGRMQARDFIEDEVPVLDLDSDTKGGIIFKVPLENGVYAISIAPDQTAGLCTEHIKRVLVYDLFFDHGTDDDTGYQQKGKIIIYPAVTRDES